MEELLIQVEELEELSRKEEQKLEKSRKKMEAIKLGNEKKLERSNKVQEDYNLIWGELRSLQFREKKLQLQLDYMREHVAFQSTEIISATTEVETLKSSLDTIVDSFQFAVSSQQFFKERIRRFYCSDLDDDIWFNDIDSS